VLKRYAENIQGLKAIFTDFGRMESLDAKNANDFVSGVPTFHTLNRWLIEGDPVDYLVKQIKDATPATRPTFMSIMALSWTYKPSMVKEAMDRLGDDYVFVTPEHLAQLFETQVRG